MWKFKFLCSENVSLTISSLFGRGGMRLICSALLASALIAPVAHAQESNDDENELEEIVVTATRIPTPLADTLPTTAIITAEDIERIKPQDFGELLKLTSGIGFRDSGGRGSEGDLFVRGTSSKHVLILIDGIRTSSATTGETAIQHIPLESIERIEIIKGPMSGVYGADAIGGVIQIFTKAYQDEGAFGDVSTTAGSNQLRKHYARAGYGDVNFSVSASLSKESTDGIDRTAFKGGGNEDRDGFEQSSGNFSLSLYPQEDLVLNIGHVQSSATIEYDNTRNSSSKRSSNRDKVGEGWHRRNRLNTTFIQFDYDHTESVKLSGNFGVTTDFKTTNSPGGSSGDTSYIRTKKTDYSVQTDLILSTQSQVTFGFDYQKDEVDTNNPFDETKRTNKGVFALWQHQRSHSSTVLNARYDRNSLYGSNSNYGLQQSFDLNDEYKLIISHGTAFRAPTFNELYYEGYGNSDVKPEKSKSFELSLRASLDELLWQVNVFQTKITNLISGWPVDNTKKSTLRGVEIELSREWDDYIFRTNLDYLDAKDDETGKFLADRARASGSIELGKQINNFYVGVDAYFEHARFDDKRFLPGYTLWGLHANYEVSESLSISGKVDNLFDKEYVTNVASGGNNYQNEGRTVQISVEYKF